MDSSVATEIWNIPNDLNLANCVMRNLVLPGTGCESTFLISNNRIFSVVTSDSQMPRSWTWKNKLYQPSNLSYFSECDPFFFIAANIDNKEARCWEEITLDFPEFATDEKIIALRDSCTIAIGDLYVSNDAALLTWYKRMFAKFVLREYQRRTSEQLDPSFKTRKIQCSNLAEFCVWVPMRLHDQFFKQFPESLTTTKTVSVIAIKEDHEERCEPPPAKMLKQSTSQKRLQKAAKGTASISSFFTRQKQ